MKAGVVKLGRIAAGTLLYLAVLLGTYLVHAVHGQVDVVFYSALADVLIATSACAVLLWIGPWFRVLGGVEKLQLACIWLLLGYGFAISVPTVVDRSLSIYLLEKLDQRGGGIRQDAFEQVLVQEYLKEHRLVEVRLTEQLASGTLTLSDGCVSLTERGRRIARFSRFLRTHFLPRQRLLVGGYTDELTDPFRHTRPDVGYGCR
jgi:hypothetical protein